MLRERATRQGRPDLIKLGFSEGDLKFLRQGQPILLDEKACAALGIDGEMLVFYTEHYAQTSVQRALLGLTEPTEEPIRVRGPRPFTLRCRSCQTEYLNTDPICPACGRRAASYDPVEAIRYQREVDDFSKGDTMEAVADRIKGKNEWLEERMGELPEDTAAHQRLHGLGKSALQMGRAILNIGERAPDMPETKEAVDRYDEFAELFGIAFREEAKV